MYEIGKDLAEELILVKCGQCRGGKWGKILKLKHFVGWIGITVEIIYP